MARSTAAMGAPRTRACWKSESGLFTTSLGVVAPLNSTAGIAVCCVHAATSDAITATLPRSLMNRCRVDLSNCIRRVPSNISAQNVSEDQSVGLKRKSVDAICMSVLGRKQTFPPYSPDVRFIPKADIPQQGLECHPKTRRKVVTIVLAWSVRHPLWQTRI